MDILTQRRRLEKTLASLGTDTILQPGAVGTWSVKDLLAHLTAWERLLLDWYTCGLENRTSAIAPVGMFRSAIHAINQQIYTRNLNRPLDDILVDFHTSYQQILSVIEVIPEADMFTPGRIAWTGSLTLADYIAGNTCNHYAWANRQVKKWIKAHSCG